MTAVAGPYFAAVALLAAAGLAKLLRPRSTAQALRSAGLPGTLLLGRLLGAGELVVGVTALLVGDRLTAALVAAWYLGFALFALRLLALGEAAHCGCFGEKDAPVTAIHVALNLTASVAAGLAAGWPVGSLRSVLTIQPWAGLPFLALVALLAWQAYATLALLPELAAANRDGGAGGFRP